nr:hypothetical protein [Chryseobacterium sp. SC28]
MGNININDGKSIISTTPKSSWILKANTGTSERNKKVNSDTEYTFIK